jgi:hypothetical protein
MIEKIKMHILPLIYAYIICSFLYWDCNIIKWDVEQRFILIIFYAFTWLISFLISYWNSFDENDDYIDDFDDE